MNKERTFQCVQCRSRCAQELEYDSGGELIIYFWLCHVCKLYNVEISSGLEADIVLTDMKPIEVSRLFAAGSVDLSVIPQWYTDKRDYFHCLRCAKKLKAVSPKSITALWRTAEKSDNPLIVIRQRLRCDQLLCGPRLFEVRYERGTQGYELSKL